jgi:predicted metal-dependent hydrolase
MTRRAAPAASAASSAAPSLAVQLELPWSAPGPQAANPVPTAPKAGKWRHTLLAGQPCRFQLRRARRRTIGFQIDDDGLTVSAPRWVSLKDIEAALAEKQRWIRAKLQEWQALRERRRAAPRIRWCDGGELPYLGETLTMRLSGAGSGATESIGGELRLPLCASSGEEAVRVAVEDWMKAQARRLLGERVDTLSQRGGVRPLGWRLSSARTRWGSCNEDGRIMLNWRLLFYPGDVIDYVVAHELAHLAELNHSPRFWREVGRLLPGFETARAKIKDEELAGLPI